MVQRFETGARMSEMTLHNGVCYLAGQVATGGATDIQDQTREVLSEIDRLLALAGSDKSRLLRAEIFLDDMGDFAGMNSVWESWLPAGQAPARATVQARLARPEWKVEIVITAAA